MNALPTHILLRHGFRLHRAERVPLSERRYYSMRIPERTFLVYDRNDGFVMLWRKTDKGAPGARGGNESVSITLPKPIRTEQGLRDLLSALLP